MNDQLDALRLLLGRAQTLSHYLGEECTDGVLSGSHKDPDTNEEFGRIVQLVFLLKETLDQAAEVCGHG